MALALLYTIFLLSSILALTLIFFLAFGYRASQGYATIPLNSLLTIVFLLMGVLSSTVFMILLVIFALNPVTASDSELLESRSFDLISQTPPSITKSSFTFQVPDTGSSLLDEAIQALSDSGFTIMSERLRTSPLLPISKSSPLTIFAPTDSAVKHHSRRRPDLNFQLCPLKIPLHRIATLPYGAMIPTYLPDPLTVTTTPSQQQQEISLNRISVNSTPVFDSGPIVIYAVEDLFDPSFRHSPPPCVPVIHKHSLECRKPKEIENVRQLSIELNRRGYSVLGDFLELQLVDDDPRRTALTVFSPPYDVEVEDLLRDFSGYSSFFRRHVVPCKLPSHDLRKHARFRSYMHLPTFLSGYTISITRSPKYWRLNGVPVMVQDVHNTSRQVATYAINRTLALGARTCPGLDLEFHISMAEQHTQENNGNDFCASLRKVPACAVSDIIGRPNLSVMSSNMCVDQRAVDGMILNGSIFSQSSSKRQRVYEKCKAPAVADYRLASDAVKAIGNSFMSSFLDMQLMDTGRATKLTVLAPLEDDIKHHWFSYIEHYKRHVVTCKVIWSQLITLEEGTKLDTLDAHFKVVVTRSNATILVNDEAVIYPDLYTSDRLVIHGIRSKVK